MLKFTKMHGLGNDFIVIDAINQKVDLTIERIQSLTNRHFGIGCDQLLLVEKSTVPGVDFRYRIFNADGEEVEQCGNGIRCFAIFIRDKFMAYSDTIAVETSSGIIYPMLQDGNKVKVDMGLPCFAPDKIPFYADKVASTYSLLLDNNELVEVSVLSIGNPHAVMLVKNIELAKVENIGPLIENHSNFPARVNAGFMQIIDTEHIMLRVYERGVGETKACGTGACAAVVSGIKRNLLAREVKVEFSGGKLLIIWPDNSSSVWMTGPAMHVFDGEFSW